MAVPSPASLASVPRGPSVVPLPTGRSRRWPERTAASMRDRALSRPRSAWLPSLPKASAAWARRSGTRP